MLRIPKGKPISNDRSEIIAFIIKRHSDTVVPTYFKSRIDMIEAFAASELKKIDLELTDDDRKTIADAVKEEIS